MTSQLSIFDIPQKELSQPRFNGLTVPHNRHKGNDQILQENRKHFENHTQIVLDHMMKGERVSGLRMMKEHGIQDIRPRIAAIKKLGYNVLEEKIKGGHGAKEWRLGE